jgi:hypothetical protein
MRPKSKLFALMLFVVVLLSASSFCQSLALNSFSCRLNPSLGPCFTYDSAGNFWEWGYAFIVTQQGPSCVDAYAGPFAFDDLSANDLNATYVIGPRHCPNGHVVGILLHAFKWYYKGGGGRACGGCGWRYTITSGTVTDVIPLE